MDNQVSALKLVPNFIGAEEIEVLNDIKTRCYFADVKTRNALMLKVCASVGATKYSEILENDFEAVLNLSVKLLRERGDKILRGKLQTENLARGLAYHGRRS